MSRELAYPFSLVNGRLGVTYNPARQLQQHVDSLVGTAPGERVMLPTYGVNAPGAVFNKNDVAVATALSNSTRSAIAQWEPTVTILGINPITNNAGEGIINIEIDYTSSNLNMLNKTNTAVVSVGGTVTDIG